MEADNSISISKSDPAIAEKLADCEAGDEITLTLKVTVSENDETALTGTVDDVISKAEYEVEAEPAAPVTKPAKKTRTPAEYLAEEA